MKIYFYLVILSLILFVSCGGKTAGSGSDVTTGSIAGEVVHSDSLYEDLLSVQLFQNNKSENDARALGKTLSNFSKEEMASPLKTMDIKEGEFEFEGLEPGEYFIQVLQDEILVGEFLDIVVKDSQVVTISIEINLVINQTFNVFHINNTEITINQIVLSNGDVVENFDQSFELKFPEGQSQQITLEALIDGELVTLLGDLTMDENGQYQIEFSNLNTDVVVTTQNSSSPSSSSSSSSSSEHGSFEIDGAIHETPQVKD